MRRGYRRPRFWRSGFVAAHCILQIANYRSEFWCLFFICVWLLHVPADIYMFLMLAVDSLRVRRCWQSANLIANMCILDIDNYVQIHQNSCKKYPKSNKMVPRNAPKTTLGANWFEDPQKVFHADTFLQTFGATWAILGAILAPAGRQGGPKIEHLGVKACPKPQK